MGELDKDGLALALKEHLLPEIVELLKGNTVLAQKPMTLTLSHLTGC